MQRLSVIGCAQTTRQFITGPPAAAGLQARKQIVRISAVDSTAVVISSIPRAANPFRRCGRIECGRPAFRRRISNPQETEKEIREKSRCFS
jgi:hypothetical protein